MKHHTNLATWHLQQAFTHVCKAEKLIPKLSKRPTIAHYVLESKKNIKALLDLDFEHLKQHEERKENE